ncbi:TetR/AcrR family transcriptional regulator [Nocardioides acrostichi]|uniref:TetR/AcrR family transcriptional regulator n=1 Tax=Nocardioides acrostichi TaxID=2784339 RepID=A0A930UX39_9ACTN|nr:TetR/AcrR family transcriptional regulator [Nocardioides acrostichi]MBF4162483.1 TetR/AcrR family transcriptional regulator [Nocardioides acrostichi]
MRTHGWGGSPPSDDAEARQRVLDAARRIVLERGRAPRMAEVARDLEVSRATLYRYAGDADDLVTQLADAQMPAFLAALETCLAGESDPARAVVAGLMFVIDRLPEDPYLSLALATDATGARAQSITGPQAQEFGRQVLGALPVDWPAAGFDAVRLSQLVEHMLRLIQSFAVDPGTPPRHGADLEAYLEAWLVPCIAVVRAPVG